MELNSEATKSQKQVKSSGRFKSRNVNIKSKIRVANSGRDRCFTGWDPAAAAAQTGQTGTRSIPTGLSSKVHFSSVVC